jgi:SAM-dependent methyltransferase
MKQDVSEIYTKGGGEEYHTASPRQRLLNDNNREVAATYTKCLLQQYSISEIGSVLEFGAGFGQNLLKICANKKIAYEPAAFAREIAKTYPELQVIDSLDSQKEQVDMVLSIHSLEHVLEPFRELGRIHELIRPGGTLFIVLPTEKIGTYVPRDENNHLYSWTPQTIGNLLVASGFELVCVDVVGRSLEYRLAKIIDLNTRLWFAMTKLSGRILGNVDIVAVAKKI